MSVATVFTDMDAVAKIGVLRDTLRWLEENPDNAITGNAATDDVGFPVDVRDPDATCFCFVGRLQREVAKTKYPYGLSLWLMELQTDSASFIGINDTHVEPAERFAALRAYINDLEKGVTA